MAQEEIVMEIKANVKSATKQVDDFTKSLTGAEFQLDDCELPLFSPAA